ncbi:hypothetical protein [Tahibacter soli]|uniref:Uncharacterized protein n=1 Tax=Tahibacter soli TaxID=2983605 RepID=A0A9X3YJ87_9GAMM|nr:hypothetical protein [Tahibacter soli]MDC8012559.1 hypothetical protein [Tahibacter soli]
MTTWWPWLAVAGLGALHGLSPANGWMFAAACGVSARDGAAARRALLPIALGHGVSIAIVAFAVTQGVLMDRALAQWLAGALLIGVAAYRLLRGAWPRVPAARIGVGEPASQAGIAAWSCLMATAHGAGLMLVPAMGAICMSDSPAKEITASGSMMLALIAVAVHLAAMLATTGAVASGVCRAAVRMSTSRGDATLRHAWTGALAVTGLALMAFR